MLDALGLLGLIILLLGGGPPREDERRAPRPKQRPQLPPAPSPWPQVVPAGLPPFPGAAWEYDEPPPLAVQQRAGQLVDVLWRQGSGSTKIEQTAGRWIVYRAEIVRSGKKGVVAYRQKKALPAPAPSAPKPAPPMASTPAPPAPSTSTEPPHHWNVDVGPATVQPTGVPISQLTLPTLRKGDGIKPRPPNPDVRLLQQKLSIEDDGQFGNWTEQAVREYQRRHGLAVDGIVGPATWSSLFGARA